MYRAPYTVDPDPAPVYSQPHRNRFARDREVRVCVNIVCVCVCGACVKDIFLCFVNIFKVPFFCLLFRFNEEHMDSCQHAGGFFLSKQFCCILPWLSSVFCFIS